MFVEMNYQMAIGANRPQVPDRVYLVLLSDVGKLDQMMNVDHSVADPVIC